MVPEIAAVPADPPPFAPPPTVLVETMFRLMFSLYCCHEPAPTDFWKVQRGMAPCDRGARRGGAGAALDDVVAPETDAEQLVP